MGLVIATSPWLWDLARQGGAFLDPCRQIIRAQIVVHKRRGHVLNLDTEYIRRRITWSARFGRVADVTVDCAVCRWQAWLIDWVKSCDLTAEQIAAILADNRTADQVTRTAFLRRCYGNLLAAELAASEHAPSLEVR